MESKTSSPRRDSSATIMKTYLDSPPRRFSRNDRLDGVYEKKVPLSTEIQDMETFDRLTHWSDFEDGRDSIGRGERSGERTDVSP